MSTTLPPSKSRVPKRNDSRHSTEDNHLDNIKSGRELYDDLMSSARIVASSTSTMVAQSSRQRKRQAVSLGDDPQKSDGLHRRFSNSLRALSGPPSNRLSATALPALPRTPMKLRPHHLPTKRSTGNTSSPRKVINFTKDILDRTEGFSRRSQKILMRNRSGSSYLADYLENQPIVHRKMTKLNQPRQSSLLFQPAISLSPMGSDDDHLAILEHDVPDGLSLVDETVVSSSSATTGVSEASTVQKSTSNSPNDIFIHYTITQDRTATNIDMLLAAVQNREPNFGSNNK